jgi:hypothetical protein
VNLNKTSHKVCDFVNAAKAVPEFLVINFRMFDHFNTVRPWAKCTVIAERREEIMLVTRMTSHFGRDERNKVHHSEILHCLLTRHSLELGEKLVSFVCWGNKDIVTESKWACPAYGRLWLLHAE